jgi:peroxiredoxin
MSRARFGLVAMVCCALVAGCSAPWGGDDHPLVGKQAPAFTATRLDDTPFDLTDHLGKDVVILDFWATWCGPCRQALPILSGVAAEYKGRGVEFFAVDLSETPAEVQQFLDDSGLDVPVVMDADGSVAEKYGVEAIPQTVIIGRDGVVRFVHIGTQPSLESRLKQELDGLISADAVATKNRTPRSLAAARP